MNRTKMHRRGAALLVVLASSVVATGCWVSPETRISQLTAERDVALRSLDKTVGELEQTRGELAGLQKSRDEELTRLRDETVGLQERVKKAEEENEELKQSAGSSRAEYEKLKETHSRLNQMAQVNLDQIASLRQLNENLLREKVQLEQDNLARDRKITKLTGELDDLQTELIRKSTEVQVASSKSPPSSAPAGAETGAVIPGQIDPLDSARRLPLEVHLQIVVSRIWDNLVERFHRVLEGTVVWDSVDIALVSTLGCLILFGIVALAYFYRVRRLRRELRQYRAYLASKRKTSRSEAPRSSRRRRSDSARNQEEDPEEEPYSGDQYGDETPHMEAVERRSRGRPRPESFSPIFRTNPGVHLEEAAAPTAAAPTAAAPTAPAPEPARPAPPVETPRQRRVIGAVPPVQKGARPQGDPDELPAATQIIMPTQGDAAAGHRGDGGEEIAVTEVMDRKSFDRARESGSHGANDEQELLDELKMIINRKLDPGD